MYSSLEHFHQLTKEFCTKLHNLSFLGIKQNKKIVKLSSSDLLSDKDYEFLFNQLLDGISHGWHEGRILKYFEDLGERGKARLWVSWLNKFQDKVLSTENPDLQLASKMMRLAELAQSFPSIEPIGKISYDIGQKLYSKTTEGELSEYIDFNVSDIEDNGLVKEFFPSLSIKEKSLIVDDLEQQLERNENLMIYSTDQESFNPINFTNPKIEAFPLSKKYFEEGIEKFNLKIWDEAIFLWDKALAINPSFSIAWYKRGEALQCLGEIDKAISSVDNALALEPENINFLNMKAQLLYNLEDWSESIRIWDKVLNIEPSNYKVWYNKGRCLESMKQISKAIESYEKALEIVPDLKPVLKRLRRLYNTKHSSQFTE